MSSSLAILARSGPRKRSRSVEAAGEHLCLQGVDALLDRRGDLRLEGGVEGERHHATLRSELDRLRLEGAIDDGARNREESVGQIDDDAADGDLRGDGVLIGIRADDERLLRLARGLKDAESRGVGVLEDDVGALLDL